MNVLQTAGMVIALLVILLIFFKLLTTPLKFIVKFIFNTLLGFVVLILINRIGSYIDISIGVNWINAAIVGVFGLAGVALLLILQWLAL